MEGFLEPDWDQPRPEPAQIEQMWEELDIPCKAELSEALSSLKSSLESKTVDGKVAIAECTVPHDKTLHWFASRNRLFEADFFAKIFQEESVRNALGYGDELLPSPAAAKDDHASAETAPKQDEIRQIDGGARLTLSHPLLMSDALGFEFRDPFEAVGVLASVIYYGSPYHKPSDNDGAVAMQNAITIADTAFGQRFGEAGIYVSYQPWSNWFEGIAWDLSIVMIDNRTRKMTVILVTDTD